MLDLQYFLYFFMVGLGENKPTIPDINEKYTSQFLPLLVIIIIIHITKTVKIINNWATYLTKWLSDLLQQPRHSSLGSSRASGKGGGNSLIIDYYT
jgi:hypothetical protein